MSTDKFDLFTGTATPELADEVSKILGIPLSAADVVHRVQKIEFR